MQRRAPSGSLSGYGAHSWLARSTSQAPRTGLGPRQARSVAGEPDRGAQEPQPLAAVVRDPGRALQPPHAARVERAHRVGHGPVLPHALRPAPDPVAQEVHGDVDREIGQHAAEGEVLGQQVVHAEPAHQRVALRAAVGDVAALDAGAVAVAQRADPLLGQRALVDHGKEDAIDVGQRQEAAAVLGERPVDEHAHDGPHRRAARPAGVIDGQQRGRQPPPRLAAPAPVAAPQRLGARGRRPPALGDDVLLPPSHHGRLKRRPRRKPAHLKHKLARWNSWFAGVARWGGAAGRADRHLRGRARDPRAQREDRPPGRDAAPHRARRGGDRRGLPVGRAAPASDRRGYRSLRDLPAPGVEPTLYGRGGRRRVRAIGALAGPGPRLRGATRCRALRARDRARAALPRRAAAGELRQGALAGRDGRRGRTAAEVPPKRSAGRHAAAATSARVARWRCPRASPAAARSGSSPGPVQPMLAAPGATSTRRWRDRRRRGRVQARRRAHAGPPPRRRGARLHAHPRRLTARVPEVVEARSSSRYTTPVLDGEAIALRPDGRPEPFQIPATAQRAPPRPTAP